MSEERPRLLVVVTHAMTASILMRGQLSWLRASGFEVALAASPGPHLDDVASREEVRTFAVPMARRIAPSADLRALLRLLGVVRTFRPHAINAGTPKAGLLGSLAGWILRVPVRVYTVRGLRLATVAGPSRHLLRMAERAAVAASTRTVYVGRSLCSEHRASVLGAGRRRHRSRPGSVLADGSSNGVDVERFRPAAEADRDELTRLRLRHLIHPGTPVIGFVGRFTRDKGIADLAAAFFDHVLPRIHNAELLLLGDWEEGDPVAEEVRARLLGSRRVAHPGFVADTAPWYRLMDVLAFPSYREGFPNAPLEAAASGVPVVGYSATGTVDAVADGVTGELVPVGDVAALADALIRHLGSPLGLERGQAGRRRAVERFSNARVWQAWRDLYAEELAAAGLPAPAGDQVQR